MWRWWHIDTRTWERKSYGPGTEDTPASEQALRGWGWSVLVYTDRLIIGIKDDLMLIEAKEGVTP